MSNEENGDILSCEGSVFCFSCLGKEIRERFVDQEKLRTSLSSWVSSFAALLSQCLKYSSTAAFCAALSFFIIALKPP